MRSIFGSPSRTAKPSPSQGLSSYHAQQARGDLQQLGQREWWLWFSAATVTALSAVAFLLTAFPRFFRQHDHFYELGSQQTRWAILCLLLLFNGWMVYRQGGFRRLRKRLTEHTSESSESAAVVSDPSGLDPVTGLLSRAAAEQHLGKEIGRAKRQNTALTLATLHLDDLEEVSRRYGSAAVDQALKEFAGRLKEASRGSDYAVRLAREDFLLVLPKCNLGEVSHVLKRVGPLELNCSGKKISLAYTTGWVDYQPGDMPSDLLKRATNLLHLYDSAAKDSLSATLVSR